MNGPVACMVERVPARGREGLHRGNPSRRHAGQCFCVRHRGGAEGKGHACKRPHHSPCNGGPLATLRCGAASGGRRCGNNAAPPKSHRSERGVSRRTECGHNLCAESVPIAPTEMHLSIRAAANPARVVRRLRLNAIPLPESRLRELRRAAASAERPFSRVSFHGARFCCGRAGGASQALVGRDPLPPAPVLVYSPTAIAGARPSTSGCESIPSSPSGEEGAPDQQYVRCAFGGTRRHTGHDRLARPGGLGNISMARAFVRRRFLGQAICPSRPPYRSVVRSGRAKGGARCPSR
jgi:hypothetical protein